MSRRKVEVTVQRCEFGSYTEYYFKSLSAALKFIKFSESLRCRGKFERHGITGDYEVYVDRKRAK